MPDEHPGGPPGRHAAPTSAEAPIDSARRRWAWWLRLATVTTFGAAWVMHDLAPFGILALGIVLGVFLDRFILIPLAVLLVRLDERLRSR